MEHGPAAPFVCTHKHCRYDKNGIRLPFSTKSSRNEHERKRSLHTCSENDECSACIMWKGRRSGKPAADSSLFCRHWGCQRGYNSEQSRNAHEHDESNHACPSTCVRCLKIRNNKYQQELRQQREAAKKKAEEERRQQRELQIERTLNDINNKIPWKALLEQHIDAPDIVHAAAQIRAVVEIFFSQFSTERCLHELLRMDPQIVDAVLTVLPISEEHQQPSLDAVVAWKDRQRIPFHSWKYTMTTFNLRKGISVAAIKRRQQELNTTLPCQPTPGGRGSEHEVLPLLQWLIANNPALLAKCKKVSNYKNKKKRSY
jgi:hypothetical protein